MGGSPSPELRKCDGPRNYPQARSRPSRAVPRSNRLEIGGPPRPAGGLRTSRGPARAAKGADGTVRAVVVAGPQPRVTLPAFRHEVHTFMRLRCEMPIFAR